jgi:hypothetical protein
MLYAVSMFSTSHRNMNSVGGAPAKVGHPSAVVEDLHAHSHPDRNEPRRASALIPFIHDESLRFAVEGRHSIKLICGKRI